MQIFILFILLCVIISLITNILKSIFLKYLELCTHIYPSWSYLLQKRVCIFFYLIRCFSQSLRSLKFFEKTEKKNLFKYRMDRWIILWGNFNSATPRWQLRIFEGWNYWLIGLLHSYVYIIIYTNQPLGNTLDIQVLI